MKIHFAYKITQEAYMSSYIITITTGLNINFSHTEYTLLR